MSTFTTRTFTEVFNDCRAIGWLNNSAGDRFPDATLLPHGAEAYGDIQEKFAENGIPLIETVTDTFSYTALQETIPIPGAITDFSEPIELWEKGTSESRWVQMDRVSGLRPPLETNLDTLEVWEWQNGAIRVLPCTANRDVFVRYRRELAYPAAGGTVGFDRIYRALIARTVYLAAKDQPDLQAKADRVYRERIESAIRIPSRDRQVITIRRKPWGYSPRRPVRQEPA